LLWVIASCGVQDATSQDPPGDPPSGPTAPPGKAGVDPGRLLAAKGLLKPGSVMQTEPRFAVPTFVWAREAQPNTTSHWLTAGVAHPELAASRQALADFAPLYRLASDDVANAVVSQVHDLGTGAVVVKYHAEIGGIEIFHEELNVVMNRNYDPVALSGYLTSAATPAARSGAMAFRLGSPAVAIAAVNHLASAALDPAQLVATGSHDGYDYFDLAPAAGIALDEPVRARPVYLHTADGLEAAYYVEVMARTGAPDPSTIAADGSAIARPEAYAYVLSAATGQVLFEHNLMAEAVQGPTAEASALPAGGFTYRVWADPVTGIPFDQPAGNATDPKIDPSPDGVQSPFAPINDVSLANFPFSQNDPWLPPGSIETVGNNADAFINLFSPDGFGPVAPPSDPIAGDFRAQITAPGKFLHAQVPDSNGMLAEGRQGAIQQLFYDLNFLHDWYYDAGFNEAAGNAQTNNFGRGGVGNDSIRGQAQDFSGFSNANMSTPADGGRPRMRMYVFPSPSNMVDLEGPTPLGKLAVGVSMSGPQTFDVNGTLAIATFGPAPACTITNAAALAGKIAVFDFDNIDGTGCSFSTRIAQITTTTAAPAMLMIYSNIAPANPAGAVSITGLVPANTKPFVSVSFNNGQLIKAQLAAGQGIPAHLFRGPDRDGGLDNQVIFHEFFHYVSNRLVGNGSGLAGNQAGGMGEGWSDFDSMLLTVRQNDSQVASNATFNGVYPVASYVTSGVRFDGAPNQAYYFGIRRYPYSTDMTKNPLTFKHVGNGVALPVGPPVAFGADGSNNAEVHNTGEVWTTMLWECYAGLLRDTLGPTPRLSFAQAQDRMKKYVIAGLKVTPLFPTITEARDAILSVALANDLADYASFLRAFAKRGAGQHAVSADRFSTVNGGVVEDFVAAPDVTVDSATLDDSADSCDQDGVLDHGEIGRLTVTLRNTGTTALSATSITVSSPSLDLWFPDGATVAVDPMTLGATATVSLRVAYARIVAGVQEADFQVSIADPQLAATQTKQLAFRTNTDESPQSSAIDSVEATSSPETTAAATSFLNLSPWKRLQITALDHAWHADDLGTGSDQYLLSPVLTVGPGGSIGVAFDHAWSFEFDPTGNFDGGVIEMSVNGGAFVDIGAPAYNGTLVVYAGNVNPLQGRPGFVQSSNGTVHTALTQIVAPGSKVQVRFRAASDGGVGAAGWTVDNIAYTGVVETPFTQVLKDVDVCTKAPIAADLAVTLDDAVTSVAPGGRLSYRITATNKHGSDIAGALVLDKFPTDLSCTWRCTAAGGASCTASGSVAIQDIVNLPVNGTVTYLATCTLSRTTTSTSVVDTAQVTLPTTMFELVTPNNKATDTDTITR
jgi:hypothetical protein